MPGLNETDAAEGAELRSLFRFDAGEYCTALEVAPRGDFGVVVLGDGRVLGFDLPAGQRLFASTAHSGGVLGVSCAPDGARFVTCGMDAVAKVWSRSGVLELELPGGGGAWVELAAWAPRGGRIATSSGKVVRIWNERGEKILEPEPFPSTVTGIAWRADGSALAVTCYGGVHIVPLSQGATGKHLAWKGSLISIAWSPDAKIVACGSQDASVHFWRLRSGQDSQMSGYPCKPKALAWDKESKLLATAGASTVTVWDFRGKGPEGTRPLQLEAHEGVCTQLAFSPTRLVLASGSQDSSVLLWEPRRDELPQRYGFLEGEITGLCWDRGGRILVGADATGAVGAWDVA